MSFLMHSPKAGGGSVSFVQSLKYTLHKKAGQGLVEFALVLPIFLMLVFGIIEAARLIMTYSYAYTAAVKQPVMAHPLAIPAGFHGTRTALAWSRLRSPMVTLRVSKPATLRSSMTLVRMTHVPIPLCHPAPPKFPWATGSL